MKEKVTAIIDILKDRYPEAPCALHYSKDYELMIAVRLSAQCTDARVNLVTPALFEAYPTLEAMALQMGVWQGYICPVMDARRSQVYNAIFHVEAGHVSVLHTFPWLHPILRMGDIAQGNIPEMLEIRRHNLQ